MEELSISQEKLEGFVNETISIEESLSEAGKSCSKLYEILKADSGIGSIRAVMSYRGNATEDLLIYYENLQLHLNKLKKLFKTGENYLKHCKQLVQEADDKIAAEVSKK